jgi:membrane-associated protease RseP (regulator of RpoE activity)
VAISFAGPAAGFLLAAVMYVLLRAAGYDVLVYVWRFILVFVHLAPGELVGSRHLTEFIDDMFFVCVFWGIFNLLPIFPLDGGQIAQRIMVMVHPREGVRLSLVISMVAAILVAAFAALNRQFFMAGFFALMAANSYAVLGHQRGGGDPW